jgi:simple sugar transport system permease protein
VFSAVAAAVIGGILLTGGYGTAVGVVFGALTYGIVSTGIFYTGWSTDWTSLFLGGLVLLAVLANNYFRKLALAGGAR